MSRESGISRPQSASITEVPPLPKLCRQTLYGIDALENYQDENKDDLLHFFDHILEDLNERQHTGRNQFPLIKELIQSEDERKRMKQTFRDLSDLAEEIDDTPVDEREEEFSQEDIDDAINNAEEMYAILDSLRERYCEPSW